MPKLTEKQKRFCEEYLIDLNATQAAIRAGYSEKTAEQTASRMLSFVKVQEHLNKLREQQSRRTEITADMVLKELAAIAFSDRTELAQIDENGLVVLTPTAKLTTEARKAIAGIKEGKFGTEISSYDKVRALELLGKHLGIFDKRDDDNDTLTKLDAVLAKIGGSSG